MITRHAVPLAPDVIVLAFDGACAIRGTDARAAYGWVAARAGEVLATGHGILSDNSTSNATEYSALVAGLEALTDRGLTGPLIVCGDSELVVDQLLGIKRVESPRLLPLNYRVRELAAAFESTRVEWVPRERNVAAHEQAQAALRSVQWPTVVVPDQVKVPLSLNPPVAAPDITPPPPPKPPPKFLKIYPGLAAMALKRDAEQGFGLWSLARALDTAGSGRVSLESLQQAAAALELTGSRGGKFKRALAQACHLDLLAVVAHRRGGITTDVVEIRSAERAARSLGAGSLGASPVQVPAAKIARIGEWRAELWAAHLAGFSKQDRLISQRTLRKLTGVPERTQREYNRTADIDVTYNIAVSQLDGRDIEVIMSTMMDHRGVFTVKDRATGRMRVAWSLPANYQVDLDRLPRGRMRKINRALKYGLVSNAAGQRAERVFFNGNRAYRAAVKAANREFNTLYSERKQAGLAPPETTDLRDRYHSCGYTHSGRGKWGVV